jgi:hypothetical protein
MRRLFIGLVVAATTALIPMLAEAGNQEVAEQIAANLRNSGQLHAYKIGVKFQDGTAWLRGQVTSEEQMRTALRLAAQTPNVHRVENELSVSGAQTVAEPKADSALGKMQSALSSTLGKLQPSSQVQPVAAQMPVQSLQQGSGAVAPEQFPRGMTSTLRTTRSRPVAKAAPTPLAIGQADRLANSFTPMPVQRVAATGAPEPTLTPQPTLAPQPTPAQPMPASQPVVQQMAAPPVAVATAPRPIPVAYAQAGAPAPVPQAANVGPRPAYVTPVGGQAAPARYDQPHMPNYSWPSYAAYPNYAGLTYPKQYSPTAWPYIGPFYPYPQVPLGWRKVSLEWHDGWWMLDFDDGATAAPLRGLFRCH